jgi:hypothetical protein
MTLISFKVHGAIINKLFTDKKNDYRKNMVYCFYRHKNGGEIVRGKK